MGVGIAAALGAAVVWAVASALIASQASRIDPFSLSLVRALWALLFLFAAAFVLGADADYGRMSAGDIAQLAGSGFLATGLAQTLYAITIPLIGLNRTFMVTTGGTVVFAFAFGAILIGDEVTWRIGLGSAVVVLGVYVVAIYGRPRDGAAERVEGTRDGRFSGLRALLRRDPPIAGGSGPPEAHSSRIAILDKAARAGRPTAQAQTVGLALAVVMGMLWGGATVWLRSASEGFEAAAASSVRMPAVVLFLLVLTMSQPGTDLRRWTLPRNSHIPLAVSGALGTGVLGLLIVISVQHISAGEFTVLFSTSPLFGMILAAIFLRERITMWLLVGALLVVGGIALMI